MRERGILRVKRQRNERDETVRLVLELTQLDQVVGAFFFSFHVAVEHGGVGRQADFMGLARDTEPHLAADLVVANDFAHAGMKNLRPTPGQGIDARLF